MRKSREQMEREEAVVLAPYAQASAASAGRPYPEPSHPYRTEFQRDRARVIHSRAFRRLEYKTQVFLNGTGDHLRTRLTHTIEVASISRTIARALSLNEDLAEAISLAHDLGHPPVGHPGEETLDRLMTGHGGFEHNAQSLRIVELIESNYPDFSGLNLSFEVTEGLRKHQAFYDPPCSGAGRGGCATTCPSLEAQIANLADEITYNCHDLDDGLDSDLISGWPARGRSRSGRTCARRESARRYPHLGGPRTLCASIIRRLIDRQVEDVVRHERGADRARPGVQIRGRRAPGAGAADRVQRFGLSGARTARCAGSSSTNVYHHPQVAGVNQPRVPRGWRTCSTPTCARPVPPRAKPPRPASKPKACTARSAIMRRA